MIDTDKYEGHTCKWCGYVEDTHAWHYEECPIFDDPMMKHHIAEVKRLREENKKQLDVLSTLDEMIRYGNDHVEMMKALEQGLDLPETWKEMKE